MTPKRNARATPTAPLIACLALILSLGATSCVRRSFPEDKVPPLKILVMNFATPPGVRENPRDIRGWWFAASNVYQNPRSGIMMAERISSHLAPLSFVNLFSRVDLKYYFARKRQNLSQAYKSLGDEEIAKLMDEVPAIEFARELNADKVVSGRIVENYLDENRTIHWWSSVLDVEVELTDTATGTVEWSKRYRKRGILDSQSTVQDEVARRIVEDLKREYFRPLAKGEGVVAAPLP